MDNKTESLKAKAYDLIALAEMHTTKINEIRQVLIQINNEIKSIQESELSAGKKPSKKD